MGLEKLGFYRILSLLSQGRHGFGVRRVSIKSELVLGSESEMISGLAVSSVLLDRRIWTDLSVYASIAVAERTFPKYWWVPAR